ncbi:MAG: trigger factor [Deltaproteobacteria bacterium]|nr:trigger factor [Deltaproteobacteria bacterium]
MESNESLEVAIENLADLKRKIVVTVPQDTVKEAYNKIFNSMKEKVSIKGFRKGKIPQSLLEKRFEKVMKSEAIESLVPEYYEKAIKQENLKPAVRPQFDDLEIDKKKPMVFSATFEIYPEFDLPDPSVYGLEKKEAVFTDEEIQEQRERHLNNAATFALKDGEAAEGDQVVMDFVGKVEDETIAEANDQKYILGSKQFLPEFEAALTGMKKEEEKDFDLNFPSDYNEEKLRDKTAQFSVTVKEVNQTQLPEMDEAFFARYGDKVKSEEEFNQFIEDEVKFRKEHEIKTENHKIIKEKLNEVLDFNVPEQLQQEETSIRLKQAKQDPANKESADSVLEEKVKQEALEQLRFSILVQKVLDDEEIKTDENEVYRRFEMNCAMMGIRPEDLIKEEYGRQIYQQTYGMITEETVLDFIIEKATE